MQLVLESEQLWGRQLLGPGKHKVAIKEANSTEPLTPAHHLAPIVHNHPRVQSPKNTRQPSRAPSH